MVTKVIKRDGRVADFETDKIENAILRSFAAVDGEPDVYAKTKAKEIARAILSVDKDTLDVEFIQDEIEKALMAAKRKDVAKAYILYRDERRRNRERNSALSKDIIKKIMASDVVNQNANVDERSFGGRKGEAANVLLKQYALDYCMSEMSRNNHINNEIYIHDLDSYLLGCHNCLTIPFDDLLANGFNTRQTDVRPANSINTAFQLVAVIFQLQSLQQFGGVSASHIDWTMVPYIRKSFLKHYNDGLKYIEKTYELSDDEKEFYSDASINYEGFKQHQIAHDYAMDMTERELKQAVEGMFHNLNTLQSRSGNQLPFTSINFGTCTLPEGRMVIKAILEGSIKGVGRRHLTSIFPCTIFQCMKGVNRAPEDPNYDLFQLALKSTATRLYPNYANVDWSGNLGYDINDPRTYFSTMGCRTANGSDINAEPGQNPQLKDGRGNICPVTIILPTIAMESVERANRYNLNCVEEFFHLLNQKIYEAKDMLIERYEYICSQSPDSAKFMYENGTMYGYKPEEGIRSALKHGTLAIGQIALAETLQILIGKDHTSEEGLSLAKRIESLFALRCKEFKNEYKLNFGVYYTPAENLCYTAMKKFKEKYGVIPNVSDRDYFTNSVHVPVWHEISPFDKIDIESQLAEYSSAGNIMYVELDSGLTNNIEGLETLVNYAMDHDLPYFAVNIPMDECLECGYSSEFNDACPECGSYNIRQLRRVTGYLTGNYKTAFNKGKQQETEERFRHSQLKVT